jgi:hypothetical protein
VPRSRAERGDIHIVPVTVRGVFGGGGGRVASPMNVWDSLPGREIVKLTCRLCLVLISILSTYSY